MLNKLFIEIRRVISVDIKSKISLWLLTFMCATIMTCVIIRTAFIVKINQKKPVYFKTFIKIFFPGSLQLFYVFPCIFCNYEELLIIYNHTMQFINYTKVL